jgi:hypothetical protein
MRPIQKRIGLVLASSLATLAPACATTESGYPPEENGKKDASASTDAATIIPSEDGSVVDPPIVDPPVEDTGAPAAPVQLPFFVSDQFIPSGFMGDSTAAMNGITLSHAEADCKSPRAPGAGGDCYTATWTATVASGASSWAGVYWQSPAENWGSKPGKPIQSGATKLTFYAAGKTGNEKIELCAGGINTKGNDPSLTYRDKFSVKQPAVALTTEWAKYELSLVGANYDSVLGGFCWVASATTSGSMTFYIDDIRWE